MERKISKAGGISIPVNMRRDLGIESGEKVNIAVQEDGKLIVDRIEGTCIFCGSTEQVTAYRGKFVCCDCKRNLEGER